MKLARQFLLLWLFVAFAPAARAGDDGVATCGPNDGYVTLYSSLDTFEMKTRLPCGDKLELLEEGKSYAAQHAPFIRIQTVEGIEGYIARAAVTIPRPATKQSHSGDPKQIGAPPAVDDP